jgi:transposase
MQSKPLPEDKEALKVLIADRDTYILQLEERIRLLNSVIFGAKSEKSKQIAKQDQYTLFDEAGLPEPQKPQGESVIVPAHERKKPGRRPIPADLPRKDVIHDLPESEKVCVCGCAMTKIGEEVSEKLDIEPARVLVERHIRYKYACRGCEGVESQAQGLGGAVKLAPLPAQLIPQGIVTPGLLAYTLAAKFVDALPFYRQEAQFARLGVDISRATLCNWARLVGKAIEPLIELLRIEIRSGPIIAMDETRVQVLKEPGRANTSQSYMWVMRGGPPEKPAVLFHYAPSRCGKVAKELVGDFRGYLQTDGYLGYESLGEQENICHIGCLAHVRRKFNDVLKAAGKGAKPGTAKAVLEYLSEIYRLEAQALAAGLSPVQIADMREAKVGPILGEIEALLDVAALKSPPKSLLGAAVRYARNQWDRILAYLEDGRLRPDNNLTENAIRPFAVGRKNWLFSGSPRGAESSAAIYSLIETAKANGLEPYAYLRALFEHLPSAQTQEARKALLPQHLDRSLLPTPVVQKGS